jgi:hypothetical protein
MSLLMNDENHWKLSRSLRGFFEASVPQRLLREYAEEMYLHCPGLSPPGETRRCIPPGADAYARLAIGANDRSWFSPDRPHAYRDAALTGLAFLYDDSSLALARQLSPAADRPSLDRRNRVQARGGMRSSELFRAARRGDNQEPVIG